MLHRKLIAGTAALLFSAQAQAATFAYSLTGNYTASWTMDSNPTVGFVSPGGYFGVYNVGGTFAGFAEATTIVFSNANAVPIGGLTIPNARRGSFASGGPQLYDGPEMTPTMRTGTFSLRTGEILTVINLSAIPEPASWMMMLTGFGLAGTALRQRKAVMLVRYA